MKLFPRKSSEKISKSMELTFRGTFRRDYQNVNNKELFKALAAKINEVKSAGSLQEIQNLKKLRKYETRYRIELRLKQKRIYWILCVITAEKIEFIRLKPEQFFKKTL